MTIGIVADKITMTNGLYFICEYLKDRYPIEIINANQAKSKDITLVLTNIPEVAGQHKKKSFFLLTEDNLNLLRSMRRRLVSNISQLNNVFVFSKIAHQYLLKELRVQSIVQYPYIPKFNISHKKEIITHNIDTGIFSGLNFKVNEFKSHTQLKDAAVFVYRPLFQEVFNVMIPLANANGISCVLEESPILNEYRGASDILLNKSSSKDQWRDAVKQIIKGNPQNATKAQQSHLRFNNLFLLESKIKDFVNPRNKNKTSKVKEPLRYIKIPRPKANNIREIKNTAIKNTKAIDSYKRRDEIIKHLSQKRAGKDKDNKRVVKNKPTEPRKPKPNKDLVKNTKSPLNVSIVATPSWFTNNEEVDVSIIVPLYKSEKYIREQIKSWDLNDDGLTKEIIYINNCDPQKSNQAIIEEWEKKRSHLKNVKVGKIIQCSKNIGFGPGNNLGSTYALGKHLLFLNADCTVTKNWIKPMYDLLQSKEDIGIVGNIQLRLDGKIDSAGSEFSWDSGSFEHVGRNVLDGSGLAQPLRPMDLPPQIKNQPSEREMVTGCCFMMTKDLFNEVEGFDINYKIGYWEDTDINLKVKEAGYKIYLQPKSTIFHKGGHSGGNHPWKKDNKQLFYKKWVHTGKIDSYVKDRRAGTPPFYISPKNKITGKVVGCIIACNEEEFLEVSMESVSSIVDEFIVVVGGNQYAVMSDMCNEKGLPNDATLDIAYSLKEKYDVKIVIPPGRPWKDKVEMRNAYARYLNHNDWMFVVDADEVYSGDQISRVTDLMKEYEVIVMQYYLFWNNVNTLGIGSWGKYPQERIVKWKNGYHYQKPNHLFVSKQNGDEAKGSVPTFQGQEKLFYHYAYIRPLYKIRQKIEYYINQLHYEWKRKDEILDKYVDEIYLKWRKDPFSIKSTHPRGGGSFERFSGMHPKGVAKLIQEGKLDF